MNHDPGFSQSADVHVRPLDASWEVRRGGERYPVSRHRTRWSAVKMARTLAAESHSTVFLHAVNGTITTEAAAIAATEAIATAAPSRPDHDMQDSSSSAGRDGIRGRLTRRAGSPRSGPVVDC
jgi:hypothetical protein